MKQFISYATLLSLGILALNSRKQNKLSQQNTKPSGKSLVRLFLALGLNKYILKSDKSYHELENIN